MAVYAVVCPDVDGADFLTGGARNMIGLKRLIAAFSLRFGVARAAVLCPRAPWPMVRRRYWEECYLVWLDFTTGAEAKATHTEAVQAGYRGARRWLSDVTEVLDVFSASPTPPPLKPPFSFMFTED